MRFANKRFFIISAMFAAFNAYASSDTSMLYPIPLSDYPCETGLSLLQVLKDRVSIDPFNLVASIIFLLAIAHTFAYRQFANFSHKLKIKYDQKIEKLKAQGKFRKTGSKPVSFWAIIFHYLGEIEVVFAVWTIPLFLLLICFHGTEALSSYLNNLAFTERKFIEPVFVVVVMAISATKPIIQFAESIIRTISKIGNMSPASWWCSILCVGPLLGSFITEPAAITISAMLLAKKVFVLKPSKYFKYGTLALLLVSISAGGTLTHFAAPPVLMVANKWGWDLSFMFWHFGLRAIVGVLASVLIGYIIFKKEFSILAKRHFDLDLNDKKEVKSKKSVVFVHLLFLAYSVIVLHQIVLLVLGYLLFVAFTEATKQYQNENMSLRMPVLVGLFLAGLVIHGGFQAWWIEPVLSRLGTYQLFCGSIFLTAFNDNAAITYLASLVPNFSAEMKFLVVAGAVTGGGLTVIANAPNPAGVSILSKSFRGGVSPLLLLIAAILPTLIMASCFLF